MSSSSRPGSRDSRTTTRYASAASLTSAPIPSSRPRAAVIAAIDIMSMYSRIIGASAALHDPRHRLGDLGDGAKGREHGRGMRLTRVEPQDRLGDDRERALGSDDQLGEVVAGGGLHELAAGPDDLAGTEHRFEPEHLVAGDPVFHGAHAARVGRHGAAEARAALTWEHRVHETVPRGDLVELAQAHARLHDGDLVVDIDLEDAGHLAKRDQDAALAGHTRAR